MFVFGAARIRIEHHKNHFLIPSYRNFIILCAYISGDFSQALHYSLLGGKPVSIQWILYSRFFPTDDPNSRINHQNNCFFFSIIKTMALRNVASREILMSSMSLKKKDITRWRRRHAISLATEAVRFIARNERRKDKIQTGKWRVTRRHFETLALLFLKHQPRLIARMGSE